jgi:hypothetical protein
LAVQVLLEYTVYVTVPEALATLVPAKVAESVTGVPVGTEIEAPDWLVPPLPLPQVPVAPADSVLAVPAEDWFHPDPELQLPPLPERDVLTLTGVVVVVDVTVSTSEPQVLVEAALIESPE